ncbi:hypothetical protein [Streptomyces parvus]|uniref:Uncharacterized protein n=1 Tax=Streptomyces parvus TaxID=66428 RepID=A0A5D4JB05_9ACTN|nr:hypothetical protein [Streptomyces parvus]TYR62717.1 hypothetical protein FY004_18345 [Streptomyces parvus]
MDDPNSEQRYAATGLLAPAPRGARSGDSLDALVLTRDAAQRVCSSRRVAAEDDTAAATTRAVRALLAGAQSALGDVPAAPLQSAVAMVNARPGRPDAGTWWSARVLARLETVGGPVLVGTACTGSSMGATGSPTLDVPVPQLPHGRPLQRAPRGWADRQLIIAPPVAAQLVAGAWLALTSGAARRQRAQLAGRRVFPGLGLTDLPAEHPTGVQDDAGHPVVPVTVTKDGVLGAMTPDPRTGLLAGRSVWDHDSGRCTEPAHTVLALTGPGGERPHEAVELAWCVEGLQRYHADGALRLNCLARTADRDAPWFPLQLRAKPQRLLQAVRALAGPAHTVHTDHTVTTAALLLPSARVLAEKGIGTVANP